MRNHHTMHHHAARRYRIALESMAILIERGRGDITIGTFQQAIDRLMLNQHADVVQLIDDDMQQIKNTVIKATHLHEEGQE